MTLKAEDFKGCIWVKPVRNTPGGMHYPGKKLTEDEKAEILAMERPKRGVVAWYQQVAAQYGCKWRTVSVLFYYGGKPR